jgi:hypothetical protein
MAIVALGDEHMRTAQSGARGTTSSAAKIIDVNRISNARLQTEPFRWAAVSQLFTAADAAALAATFPRDHFKRVADHAGDKKHEYEVRSLIRMSATSVSGEKAAQSCVQALARDFLSPGYRSAMSELIGVDLSDAEFEVNVFHYPPGGLHGAHTDHPDKIVTHVLYFNESWNDDDGGLPADPEVSESSGHGRAGIPARGNSAVLVRFRPLLACRLRRWCQRVASRAAA